MARLLLVAFMLWSGSLALAADDRTLTIGYLDFPPYMYQNPDGEADGVFVRLTRQVAQEAGYELDFRFLPAARAYQYMETGDIDLWQGFVDDPTIEHLVAESHARPINVEYGVWYLPQTPQPARFSDFHGKILITITGYNYAGLARYLEQTDRIHSVNTRSHRSALNMLVRGRGDYLLDYREPVDEELQQEAVPGIRFTPLWIREAGWLFPLAAGQARQRAQDFDQAWERLLARGEVSPPEPPQSVQTLDGMPLSQLWSQRQ